MNKSFLWSALLLVVFAPGGFACEICGCGNSNFQIGMLPNYKKGFLGLRYSSSQFHSSIRGNASEFSHDYFKTTELWGGYSLKRFQLIGFVPYFNSKKVSDDGSTSLQGLGDLLLLVNYRISSSAVLSRDERVSVRNDLFVGGGVKLPTGVNQVNTRDPDFNIGDFNSQAGTGSIDYMVNATHQILWNRSGIVTNVAYRFNTENRQGYRFGNRAYLNSSYYYTVTLRSVKIKPNVGIAYQNNTVNSFHGTTVADSNGYNFNSTLGVNMILDKIGVSAMAFIPVTQNMYDGQTKLQSRILLGLTYSF